MCAYLKSILENQPVSRKNNLWAFIFLFYGYLKVDSLLI